MRVVSFLYSPEWAIKLSELGFEVDYLLAWGRHLWPHSTHEMPKGFRFVTEAKPWDYKAAIVPVGKADDGVAMEMFQKMLNFQASTQLQAIPVSMQPESEEEFNRVADEYSRHGIVIPCSLIFFDTTSLGELKRAVRAAKPSTVRAQYFKMRWPHATHPGWRRHCHFVTESLIGSGGEEPEGTLIDLQCGDGALLKFVMNRFGKLDCYGYCGYEEERDAARSVDPKIPVGVQTTTDAIAADYLICGDCLPASLLGVKLVMEGGVRKKGVITLKKEGDDVPIVFDLITMFKKGDCWKQLESPSHYIFIWEVASA